MLELHASETTNVQPTLRVSWCIGKEERDVLVNYQVVNPYLLLVARQNQGDSVKEHRQLEPLEQGETYVYFHGSGEWTVWGFIVWNTSSEKAKDLLARYSSYSYNRDIFHDDSEQPMGRFTAQHTIQGGFASLQVSVAEKFFAPEPPPWLNTWVNAWHELPPVDQCQYRKRFLEAFSLKPLLALLVFILRLWVATFFTLLLMRHVSWRPVFHLIQEDMDDIFRNMMWPDDWFFSHTKEGELRPPLLWPLIPFAPIALLMFIVLWKTLMDFTWVQAIILGLLTSGGLSLVVAAGVAILTCVVFFIWGVDKAVGLLKKLPKKAARPGSIDYSGLESVLCPVEGVLAAPRKRTVRLKFLDLKARYCKPFAE